MRKNILCLLFAVLCFFSACSAQKQWDKGTELTANQNYLERFSEVPGYINATLPPDSYSSDYVLKLAESGNNRDKKEYELLTDNYDKYGRYDGLSFVVWDGARYFVMSDKETFCFINYGINQAGEPSCFEIYTVNETDENLVASSTEIYIIDCISDGKILFVLCSDGRLLHVDNSGIIREIGGVFDPTEQGSLMSLSAESSTVSVVDYSGNTIWKENI